MNTFIHNTIFPLFSLQSIQETAPLFIQISYSDWSQWSCVTRAKGEQQQRARTCTGCIGDISQLRDRVREEQPAYDVKLID